MASRVSRGSATGFSFREIDHLGLCSEFLLKSKGPWAPGEPCDFVMGVGKVAKNDGPGRARLGAGGYVFPRLDLAILSEGPFARPLEAMVAEGAFLHDTLLAHRNIRVLTRALFLVGVPVKVFGVIRAGGHTEPTADTPGVNLGYNSLRVPVGRIDGTDLGAGRIVAVEAGPGQESELPVGVLFVLFGEDLHPADDPLPAGLLGSNGRDVVFRLAGHDAGLAPGAAVQIDHHPPKRHIRLSLCAPSWC